uniref:Uncharacterized protein n=1 Tax=Ditylenchus dipsaci TaxID=166011 RepID=A0A915DXH9_9BILA
MERVEEQRTLEEVIVAIKLPTPAAANDAADKPAFKLGLKWKRLAQKLQTQKQKIYCRLTKSGPESGNYGI